MNRKIVSAGYMPMDIVMYGDSVIAREAGGTASNVASIMAHFGWRAVLAGQVGNDHAGNVICSDLDKVGVATDQLHHAGQFETARLIYRIDGGRHGFGYKCPTCGKGFPRSRPITIAQALICIEAHPYADVFFFDRANAGTLTLARHYSLVGSTVFFEPPSTQNSAMFAEACSLADVMKVSGEGAGGSDEFSDSREAGFDIRIDTFGSGGLQVSHHGSPAVAFTSFQAETVDSGGCGDWTTAGFLLQLDNLLTPSSERFAGVVSFAQSLAAVNSTVIGARTLTLYDPEVIRGAAEAVVAEGAVSGELLPPLVRLPPIEPAGVCGTCLLRV